MTDRTRCDSESSEPENTDDSGLNNNSPETSDEDVDEKSSAAFPEEIAETEEAGPLRLLIVSSKIKNVAVIQSAILPKVIFLRYKYENATLDTFLGKSVSRLLTVLPSVRN